MLDLVSRVGRLLVKRFGGPTNESEALGLEFRV